MMRFLIRRVLWGALIVWLVATMVFGIFFVAPRDVAGPLVPLAGKPGGREELLVADDPGPQKAGNQ
jgi:ABC-type dipeptide/oligopeptide/nickel transport system permease component